MMTSVLVQLTGHPSSPGKDSVCGNDRCSYKNIDLINDYSRVCQRGTRGMFGLLSRWLNSTISHWVVAVFDTFTEYTIQEF